MSKHQIVVRPRKWINKGKKKIGSTWQVDFQYVTPDGQSRRVRQHFDGTKVDALAWGEKAKDALSTGKTLPQKYGQEEEVESVDPTFAEFADEFLRDYVVTHNKVSEQASKRSMIERHLKPFFGHLKLGEITKRQIDGYKARKLAEIVSGPKEEARTLTEKTINNQLIVLSKILRLAVSYELISKAPSVERMRVKEPDLRCFTREETVRLVGAAGGEWRTMIHLALLTGLRSGELRGLRWTDVDLERRKLHVRQAFARNELGTPKSRRSRVVDLADDAVGLLETHGNVRRSEYVFSRPDGSALRDKDMDAPFRTARDRAGIGDATWKPMWHACRHTFVSRLVESGVPLPLVQALAGHSDIKMTLRYVHFAPGASLSAVQHLNGVTKELAQWTSQHH